MYLWSEYISDQRCQWHEAEILLEEGLSYGKTPDRVRFLDGYPEDLRTAFCKMYSLEPDTECKAQSYIMMRVL